MRTINAAGLALVETFEGLRLIAYRDSAGVWTIGYGHTAGVTPGESISHAQADAFLRADLANAERAVSTLVHVPLTDNQFAALVSFTLNLGAGALTSSTLLRLINAGNYAAAEHQFGRWVFAGGQELPGLVRRRAAEADLFARPAA